MLNKLAQARRLLKRFAIRALPFLKLRLDRRVYEERMGAEYDPYMEILKPHLSNRIFLDIGAHQGGFSFHMKRFAKETVAFEPIPSLVSVIKKYNPDVQVYQCAIGMNDQQATIFVPHLNGEPILTRCSLDQSANPGFENLPLNVQVKTLDSFGFSNVGAIKIDVEGHELGVIRGGLLTLSKCKPVLLIEIEERHHPGQSLEIIETVCKIGYQCFYQDGQGTLVTAENVDFALLQPPENLPHPIKGGGGSYINNFLFLPIQKK